MKPEAKDELEIRESAWHHKAHAEDIRCSVCHQIIPYDNDPFHPSSERHGIVCKIAEDGKLSLAFNPNTRDLRKNLEDFPG